MACGERTAIYEIADETGDIVYEALAARGSGLAAAVYHVSRAVAAVAIHHSRSLVLILPGDLLGTLDWRTRRRVGGNGDFHVVGLVLLSTTLLIVGTGRVEQPVQH